MKSGAKIWPAAAAVLYGVLVLFAVLNVRDRANLKDRRVSDYQTYISLIQKVPAASAAPVFSEPLLVRLQRSVDQMGLKDRAPKLSAGPASPGQPASVSVSLEGAPFDRISELLQRISADAAVAAPQFRLERSGASDERFDFSATFIELRSGPAE